MQCRFVHLCDDDVDEVESSDKEWEKHFENK